jgi:hypothetical protein
MRIVPIAIAAVISVGSSLGISGAVAIAWRRAYAELVAGACAARHVSECRREPGYVHVITLHREWRASSECVDHGRTFLV